MYHSATLLLAEAVLLAVGRIPNPVDEQIGNVKEREEEAVPVVLRRVMVG